MHVVIGMEKIMELQVIEMKL